jgi:hypothetical protein
MQPELPILRCYAKGHVFSFVLNSLCRCLKIEWSANYVKMPNKFCNPVASLLSQPVAYPPDLCSTVHGFHMLPSVAFSELCRAIVQTVQGSGISGVSDPA